MIAPGNYIRNQLDMVGYTQDVTILGRLENIINKLFDTMTDNSLLFLVITFALCYFIFKGWKNREFILKNKENVFFMIIFLVAGIIPYFAMVFTRTFDDRVTFAPFTFFVLSFFEAIKFLNIEKFKYRYICFVFLFLVFGVCSAKDYINTCKLSRKLYASLEARDESIQKMKENGVKDAVLDPICAETNKYTFFGEITYNTNATANKSMATYYGFDSIKLRSKNYCKITFANLDNNNSNQVTVSNNEGINSCDYIRMLDTSLKNKLAPYKLHYYAFEGEEYDLNFALDIDNVEEFSVTFKEKFDQFYIKKITIYNEDEILYELYPNDLLKVIDENQNIDKIEIKNGLLYLKSTDASSYFHINLDKL